MFYLSAITGIGEEDLIRRNARTDASSVTATRTISHPSRASERIWAMVARTSRVSVFVMLWTETGALPPTYTFPTRIRRGVLPFFHLGVSYNGGREERVEDV